MISRSQRPSPKSSRFLGGLLVVALVSTGCTDFAGYDLDYILAKAPFVATMRHSVSLESQQMPRMPVPGTVPSSTGNSEILPEFTALALDSVGAALTPPPATPELIERGEHVYQNSCYVCHGEAGAGNGPVVGPGKFPLGPSLVSGTALGRSPGYIYGIIRVGRGLMPAYGYRVSHEDRWAVALYVAQLQGGAPPTATPVDTATVTAGQ